VVFSFRSCAKLRLSKLSLGFPSQKHGPPNDPMGGDSTRGTCHGVRELGRGNYCVQLGRSDVFHVFACASLFTKIASRLSPESSSAFATGHALDAHMTSSHN
jgi:hypothetical protein